MWSETFEKWLALVTEHYGSLEAFTDAPTIRIHLGTARRRIREIDAFIDSVEGKLPVEEFRPWILERAKVKNIEADLKGWLEHKGLPE